MPRPNARYSRNFKSEASWARAGSPVSQGTLPPVDLDDLLAERTSVVVGGADNAVVVMLFHYVDRSSGGAGNGEDGGEQVQGDSHRVVCAGREEIDVGIEVPGLALGIERVLHDRDQSLGPFVPLGIARRLTELLAHLTQEMGARVESAVDAVAEAGDLLAGREHLLDLLHRLLGLTPAQQK